MSEQNKEREAYWTAFDGAVTHTSNASHVARDLQEELRFYRGKHPDQQKHMEIEQDLVRRAISAIDNLLGSATPNHSGAAAEMVASQSAEPVALTDEQREKVCEAVAGALGDAYDCMRVWSAWGMGTMGRDDFALVAEDASRVAEIADAAIDALLAQSAPAATVPSDGARHGDPLRSINSDGMLVGPDVGTGSKEPVDLDGRICEHCGEGNAVLTFENGRFASNCDDCAADCDYFLVERLNQLIAAPAPSASPAPITREQIRAVFLANGFTIKPGHDDLKEYVYEAASALIGLAWGCTGEVTVVYEDDKPIASPAALTGEMRKLLTHALFWMGRTPISKESTDGMNAVRADVEALLLAASPAAPTGDAAVGFTDAEFHEMWKFHTTVSYRDGKAAPYELLRAVWRQTLERNAIAAQPSAAAEADRRDAERYRWVRDVPWFGTGTPLERVIALQQNACWDAAIDAAMGKEGNGNG
ncbi:hypothetical protein CBM2599_A120541 [Cupriavidus taiwanensis]|uniref:hypothetical protein n=1 Tax=Cupriavidus taiwanensis TaxID=164546 RepID=UPI000E143B28|nr:hypothetical protein [Cupriavidus taiwanensis]SOY79976.1 hypothetical protein CBM2599_A120541 [Cupriavidus taiwanensis]SOY81945.1 hypothetical protein CBM2600_A120563 [Cupriavidus taiwanensis]